MSAIEEVGLDLVADWKKLTEQEYQDQFKNMSLVPTVRTRTRIKKKNKSFRVLFKNIILVRRWEQEEEQEQDCQEYQDQFKNISLIPLGNENRKEIWLRPRGSLVHSNEKSHLHIAVEGIYPSWFERKSIIL